MLYEVITDEIMLIPAHIWTPWFAALGSKSGFDTIEECYGDLSGYIHAVEMGLSADQPLNWLCSFLDKYTLLSNSDAHSPEKFRITSYNVCYTKLLRFFNYGTTTAYGTLVRADQYSIDGTENKPITVTITGLTPYTTY